MIYQLIVGNTFLIEVGIPISNFRLAAFIFGAFKVTAKSKIASIDYRVLVSMVM